MVWQLSAASKPPPVHCPDQGDAVGTGAQAGMEGMHAAHAALGIVEQAGAVALADQAAEQFEIAAQIEHVAVRGKYDMG